MAKERYPAAKGEERLIRIEERTDLMILLQLILIGVVLHSAALKEDDHRLNKANY